MWSTHILVYAFNDFIYNSIKKIKYTNVILIPYLFNSIMRSYNHHHHPLHSLCVFISGYRQKHILVCFLIAVLFVDEEKREEIEVARTRKNKNTSERNKREALNPHRKIWTHQKSLCLLLLMPHKNTHLKLVLCWFMFFSNKSILYVFALYVFATPFLFPLSLSYSYSYSASIYLSLIDCLSRTLYKY